MALTDNLVSYWKLDESSGNAADATGNGNTLTNVGTTPYGACLINNGAIFDGDSAKYLDTGDGNNLGLTTTSSNTWNFWFYTGAGYSGYITDWYTSSGGNRRYIIIADAANSKFYSYNTPNDNGLFGPTLSANTWYMVTEVINGGSSVEVFVNGTSYGTKSASSSNGNVHNQFGIRGQYNPGAPLTGKVDEVGVWNRALSSSEITQLYNSGAGLQYPFTTTPVFSPAMMQILQQSGGLM